MQTFLILCFFGFINAQLLKPCVSPRQWEARVHSYNPQLQAKLVGKLSYDSVYHRTRVLQDVQVGTTETHYDIITLYDMQQAFFIDMKTGACSCVPFNQTWSDYGIQPDAKPLGEAYIGSSATPGGGLLITSWTGNRTIPLNQTVPYIGMWTYEGCLPVSDITFEPNNDINFMYFYDITIGINDPTVFIPPVQCLTDDKVLKSDPTFDSNIQNERIVYDDEYI